MKLKIKKINGWFRWNKLQFYKFFWEIVVQSLNKETINHNYKKKNIKLLYTFLTIILGCPTPEIIVQKTICFWLLSELSSFKKKRLIENDIRNKIGKETQKIW